MADMNTVATLRVMPESLDVDLENLEGTIKDVTPSNMEFYKAEKEPIAFGLFALNVIVLTNDKEGGDLDPIINAIKEIEGVSEVDVTDVRRLL